MVRPAGLKVSHATTEERRTYTVNVKTRTSAHCGSNHQLLCATVKVRMKSKKKQCQPPKYNITRIRKQLTNEIQNRFAPLLDQYEDWRPEELWT